MGCDAPFTVRHFLFECGDLSQLGNKFFYVNNMKQLFQDIHIDFIMISLKGIDLFNKIKFWFLIVYCFSVTCYTFSSFKQYI